MPPSAGKPNRSSSKALFDTVRELNPVSASPVPALRQAFEKFKRNKGLDIPYHEFTAELQRLACTRAYKEGSILARHWLDSRVTR